MTSENDILNLLKKGVFENTSPARKQISKEKLSELQEKAEKFDTLEKQYTKLESENKTLSKKVKELEHIEDKLEAIQKESERHLESLKRVTADFQNYKKRTERQNKEYKTIVREQILRKLLNHYEDLLRAKEIVNALEQESVQKGFHLIIENFKNLLKEEGIEKMECEGQKFDPYKHEALIVEENQDLPQNTITEVFEDGYYMNDKVMKPARVKVSKKSC